MIFVLQLREKWLEEDKSLRIENVLLRTAFPRSCIPPIGINIRLRRLHRFPAVVC